ncbi:hypothetical protein P154DRAFT_596029 [Amniculicola lignicola CBS 123094]|uniref:Uncharacterized protein n=1 Tax=Amniculicola lignicola CBS 123094 TaxID=1392246 RepID=A0A6A5WJ81_9PLEO|nr:hypothetical protein P154DRAFT_596029 [Amniculicola lignicola CBS 123094]
MDVSLDHGATPPTEAGPPSAVAASTNPASSSNISLWILPSDFVDPHRIAIKRTQKLWPELVVYCEIRGVRWRDDWEFIFWFPDPTDLNPKGLRGIKIGSEHTPDNIGRAITTTGSLLQAQMEDDHVLEVWNRGDWNALVASSASQNPMRPTVGIKPIPGILAQDCRKLQEEIGALRKTNEVLRQRLLATPVDGQGIIERQMTYEEMGSNALNGGFDNGGMGKEELKIQHEFKEEFETDKKGTEPRVLDSDLGSVFKGPSVATEKDAASSDRKVAGNIQAEDTPAREAEKNRGESEGSVSDLDSLFDGSTLDAEVDATNTDRKVAGSPQMQGTTNHEAAIAEGLGTKGLVAYSDSE